MRESAGKGGILMLLGNNPYPQDPRVRREATALADAGYPVTVICPGVRGQPARETVGGVHVLRYRQRVNARGMAGYLVEYLVTTAAALRLSIRVTFGPGFDVIHAHNPPDTFVLVAALYKMLGKRFVFDHHDLAPEMYDARFGGRGNRLAHFGLTVLERYSCRLADRVVATNESYKAVDVRRGNVPPERIAVVRNGSGFEGAARWIPTRRCGRAPRLSSATWESWACRTASTIYSAPSATWSSTSGGDTLCVLIGRGDARDDLQRLARELSIDDHVWFTGFIPTEEVVRYLSTVDVCVVPDPSNPFNDRSTMIKVMDYMTFARPIVAFDLPETRITAGEAASYVRPNDDFELARRIVALMDDPTRRAEMGACGRTRVVTELGWERSVPNLLALYRSLLPTDGFR